MADPYVPLPDEGESVDALIADHDDSLRDALPGWEPSDGALEVAERAAFADEGSTLYSLLRERATDWLRDYGADVLGIVPGEATPASTTTTWTAAAAAPAGGYVIDAGQQLVVDAPQGRVPFEVVNETTIPEGQTVVAGVLIQALDAGSAATLADGPVLFDEQPVWVDTVTLDAPATGGTDGESDDDYLARILRSAELLSRAPILPSDFELVAQEIATVARALVRDLYDDTTGLDDQERTVSIYPVTADGLACSAGVKADIAALVASRREVNWVVRVADPTYTTVNVDITVTAEEGVDRVALAAAVEAAIRAEPLNPGVWGQPPLGERMTWKLRRLLRRYEVAATADGVEGAHDVVSVYMSTGTDPTSDQDITLAGAAPLPLAGVVNVTVVDPE